MIKLKKIIFFALFLPLTIFSNGIKVKTEEIIKSEFGNRVEISFQKFQIPSEIKSRIELTAKQRFFSSSIFIWKISRNDTLIAIGLMDNVYGKAKPITFLTIFNLNGSIQSNHIVKYREEHGGQIVNKDWNSQFNGMNKNSNFSEVDGISGATISVNSIKKGVKKLMLIFKKMTEF